jgi:hypothetical protein
MAASRMLLRSIGEELEDDRSESKEPSEVEELIGVFLSSVLIFCPLGAGAPDCLR